MKDISIVSVKKNVLYDIYISKNIISINAYI